MRIGEIEIPDSEVEKLSRKRRQLLLALVDASPYALTTWSVYMAGGTGAPARIMELNVWLDKYNLIIRNDRIGAGTWKYWIQDRDALPIGPKEVVGQVGV